MVELARLAEEQELRSHVAVVEPGGVLGEHPTRLWQLFYVAQGVGWVRTQGGRQEEIREGQAVLWAPGEVHESGSDQGMTVVIVQSSGRLPTSG